MEGVQLPSPLPDVAFNTASRGGCPLDIEKSVLRKTAGVPLDQAQTLEQAIDIAALATAMEMDPEKDPDGNPMAYGVLRQAVLNNIAWVVKYDPKFQDITLDTLWDGNTRISMLLKLAEEPLRHYPARDDKFWATCCTYRT